MDLLLAQGNGRAAQFGVEFRVFGFEATHRGRDEDALSRRTRAKEPPSSGAICTLGERIVIHALEEVQAIKDRFGGEQRRRTLGPNAVVGHTPLFQLEPEIRRLRDQMIGPQPVLLVLPVGQRGGDIDPFIRCGGRGDTGFLVTALVVEDAKGDRHHIQAIEVTVLTHGVVGGA